MSVFAGIDISAKSFDLAIRSDGQPGKTQAFDQTPEGFKKVCTLLKKKKAELIVMEATGIYHLDLAMFLVENGFNVSVINPLSAKRFAELKLAQSKTDALDAALLAEYAEVFKPRIWTPPSRDMIDLKDIGRHINRLTKDKVKTKNRLHALKSKSSHSMLIADLEDAIELYERRILRLTTAALEIIKNDESLTKAYQCLQAAVGVGEATAIAILAEFVVIPKDMKSKQVSRYCGLDIRISESGSSVKGKSRISKAGNAYLRSALYMPSLSAARYDANVQRFKQNLLDRGKTKRQAQVAIMRKYLTGLWSTFRNEEPFNSDKLFNFS